MGSLSDVIRYDDIVYSGCGCECFVKVAAHNFGPDEFATVSVDYCQTYANDFAHRSRWRSRIVRAWKALRNQDNLPGFEFYEEEDALEFSESFAKAVWAAWPDKDDDDE